MTKRGFLLGILVGASSCLPLAAVAQAGQTPATPAPAVQAAQAVKQADSTKANADHVIIKGDVLTVTVMRHPEFSSDYPITDDSALNVLGVGNLSVVGKTVASVSAEIVEALKQRLKKPEVYINVKTLVEKVSVGGDVKSPGQLDARPGWHVSEYLSAAGGLNNLLQPGECEAVVTRVDGKQERYSVLDVLQNRNNANPELKPGDVVVVVAVEAIPVFVSGEVQTPGVIQVRKDRAGILQALSMAGGVKMTAAITQVKIVRSGGGEVIVNLGPAILRGEDTANLPKLESGDLILVPQIQAHYSVLGAVSTPGLVPIRDPQQPIRMSDVIAAAKADPSHARLSKVQLVRMVNGKEQRTSYDIGKYFKTGDPKENPQIVDGDMVYVPDVNETKTATYVSGLSIAAVLFRLFGK
jgi:protein involved in polysaccharide export with SLBB domain